MIATLLRRSPSTTSPCRAVCLAILAGGLLGIAPSPTAAQQQTLAARIEGIASRPEFRGAMFGVKVAPVEGGSPLFVLNGDKLFVPGSTTKLLTVGTALELLGTDFRFRTRVYRTGPIDGGILDGDVVLVASGDPNLSQRVQGDSLLFVDQDHSYSSDPATAIVPGDPLTVLRGLAEQMRARGVRRVRGSVRVDASVFDANERELGTGTMLSPIVVNDNIVDVVIRPGANVGDPVRVSTSPETPYLRVVIEARTVASSEAPAALPPTDRLEPDGTRTLVLRGAQPLGSAPVLYSYKVPEPVRFAEAAFRRAIEQAGIAVEGKAEKAAAGDFTSDQMVAEHVSPPFREAAKVILKVSQNLHASLLPWIIGSVKRGARTAQAGFDLEREFLTAGGLDLTGAVQSDGAGGAALYSPDFMVSYLQFMARQKTADAFLRGLPILGRDGTLARISVNAPAAGHVVAKTGTYVSPDLLNRGLVVDGKGLAGYLTTRSGRRYAFAIYINRVKVSNPGQIQEVVGQAAGDIAAAMYDAIP